MHTATDGEMCFSSFDSSREKWAATEHIFISASGLLLG